MKLPPKFALAFIPVALIHLVVIVMFGVMTGKDDAHRVEVADDSLVSNDIEIPSYYQLATGAEVIAGVDSSLFPERGSHQQIELRTFASTDDSEPVASEVVKSEAATIFPFDGAEVKHGHAIPSKKEEPQQAVDVKAKSRISSEPAPGIRGFRPINAKKAS